MSANQNDAAAGSPREVPLEAVRQLQQERDHLLLLHEALADVERAPSMDARLHVFVEAIRQIGFGRVTITLRDDELNATAIVSAGLSPAEEKLLRAQPVSGAVWTRRLAAIERFRISGSYYLEGRDPWVIEEFQGGLRSSLAPSSDPEWSPQDTLLVPLRLANGTIVATLVLDDPADRTRPTLTRVRTVELFGQQVASMLEQASLMALAERRARRLQHLHEAGSSLSRSLDEPTILRSLAAQIESVLPVSTVVVLATDAKGVPWPRVLRINGEDTDEMFTPVSLRALGVSATKEQRPIAQGTMFAVPSVIGPTAVAAVVVETANGQPLDADDADLLLTIGAQAAAAISNARLYAESLRQRGQSEALADVVRVVGESLRIDRVMQLILRHASALLRTNGATIALLRGDSLEVTAGIGVGNALMGSRMPLQGSVSGRVIRSASSVIKEDVNDDPDAFVPSAAYAQITNAVIVPLLSVQGPVGVLSVFNRAEPFLPEEAEFLQRLADQVSVAVVNAKLFEEVAEATREWAVAFDSIGSGMVLLDKRGRIQRTNAQARVLLGVSYEDEVLGRDFHTALFGDDAPCDQCVHFAAITQGMVKRGTHDDRVRGRVFEVTAAPHPLGGAVVTFDDVTAHQALAERHRRVVETSRDAIVITDRERRIIFANPAAHELLGRGAELIGMAAERSVPEDQHAEVREHEDKALAGEPQNYEGEVMRPDGDRRIVAIATAPMLELGKVTGIVATLRDITDERRARDAVAQSESRYRNLFESASDAIYTLDAYGAFTSANQATCELTGLPRDTMLGRSTRMVLDEEDIPLVLHHFERALGGQAARYECRVRRPNGERRLVSVTNTPIRRGEVIVGILGVARDVTEARARAVELELSEARYARLVESASDAIFTVDVQGLFTAVNRSLEQAVGREREALIGTSFAALVDPRDLAAAQHLLRETIGGSRSRGAIRYLGRDGAVRHGSVITSPVLEGSRIVGALGILRDVTDEQRLAEQLLQQEKLVAVGQLVSGVAHELNNPLAAVMAFAQLLLGAPDALPDEPRQAVETIHREAKRAAKIVSSLLTFARQQPAERAAAQLNDIVTDTLELRRYTLRTANVEVTLDLDPTLPSTWADPFQLQQVVLNIVANAEQALGDTAGVRRIVVRTATEAGGTRIVLSVSDNGPGVPREQVDRIFNPFYTTKPVGQGTGLGLSISDGIVREHGGRIRVDSKPGSGATFIVELPYVAPPVVEPVQAAAPEEKQLTGRRMLIVDDEPAMRAAVSGFLTSLGHKVHVAANGADARALLATSEYDVVLLDLRMPDLGGEALFRDLLQHDARHARRVVFVTGDLQSDAAQHFLTESGRPFIGKPFQLDDLATVLASVTN
ncbi:MAG: PAS domain S-box protein [Gemmatimonadaceae bacterium]